MTGYRGYDGTDKSYSTDITEKLGIGAGYNLTNIHQHYISGKINFEQMRQQAIAYMKSLK